MEEPSAAGRSRRSKRETSWPRERSSRAEPSPKTPPPITMIFMGGRVKEGKGRGRVWGEDREKREEEEKERKKG